MAHQHYNAARNRDALAACEQVYQLDAYRTDNLLLLGAVHFQLRNYSECIFYNQQAIRIDPNFAEAYGNLGNALKELGDLDGAIQFYLKAIKLKPRFCDAYNNLASVHMHLGNSKQAIETYQMALMLNPALVDAHSNLGNLYKAQGALEDAKKCYMEAIRLRPDFAIAWSNLAGIFKDTGDLDTALAYYKEAIRLAPDFADAYSNMGNALKELGLLADAKAAYQEAIRLRPDFAIAHGNLASCFYDEGDMKTAIRLYKHAIQLEPNFPDAYNNLGNAYRETGLLEESMTCYQQALALKSDHPHAYNNLGNSLKDKGLIKEAVHCYTTAIRLMPSFAAAHSNLASILKEQGRFDQAIAHYQQALLADPKFSDAYSNMGNAYKDLGRLDEAIRCYTTAIKLRPTFADAYSNLASAYKDGGKIEEAIACYRKALELRPYFPDAFSNLIHSLVLVCDWRTREEDFSRMTDLLEDQVRAAMAHSAAVNGASGTEVAVTVPPLPAVQPFHALVYPLTLTQTRTLSQAYADRCKFNVKVLEMAPFRFRARMPGQRLRIGYMSSDFGNHPLSHLMQSVFGLHDRSQFDVFCYALSGDDQSQWRRRITGDVEHFKDVSQLLSQDLAKAIHADGIHILINLNGYTKGARNEVFALQPAPIQVSYMGFCGTMGADYIQYMVGDRTVIPQSCRHGYTESVMYMPHSYFVNDHKQTAQAALDPDVGPKRSDYGVPEDKFVFANFNQIYKIDPAVFRTWMRILKRVPHSCLWLLRFPPSGEMNIRAAAAAEGVADDRIIFTNVASKEEHILRGKLADLFLDTPVCNAHTTGCDILWGGTPMVTVPGERMASRVASSLLNAAGLAELVVDSLASYEELAVGLALDLDRLHAIRSKLEDSRISCPLFDTARWVRNFESGLKLAWSKHEMGQVPSDIDVPDAQGGLDSVIPPVSIIAVGTDGPVLRPASAASAYVESVPILPAVAGAGAGAGFALGAGSAGPAGAGGGGSGAAPATHGTPLFVPSTRHGAAAPSAKF